MFDYLGVLISVILGLALTHILLGYSRQIHHRHTIRVYWVQLFWGLNVLTYVLAIWWGMFWWKHLQIWTIETFLALAIYAIVQFLLASVLFPGEFSHVRDHEAMFFDNRRWFFGLLLVAHLCDIPETAVKQVAGLRGVPGLYWIIEPIFLGISITGLVTSRRAVHALLAPLWLAALLSYLICSSLDRIVAG